MTVGFFENPNAKDKEFQAVLKGEYDARANVKRICDTVKGENNLQTYIDHIYNEKKWTL